MFRILLLISLMISLLQATAQDNQDDKPHKITIIAGWNSSKYVGGEDAIQKTDFKSGLILGLSKDIKISPFVWSNGGLLYYQNGAENDAGTFKFDYLMIPAGLKLRFGPAYAMGGGYGAYRISATLDNEELDKNDFNRLDFGTYAGVGLRIFLFSLNFKYNWGLSDVSNGSNDRPPLDLRNQFYSVTLGIGIP
jgi:hypothetical protein